MKQSVFSLHRLAGLGLLALGVSVASAALAQSNAIYGDAFTKEEHVTAQQAQIVMYRGNDAGKVAAHIYIDGELQTALMPGGYTVFCTPAGEHSLESYVGDAPKYIGKRNPQSYATFEGGKTYVLEAPVGANQHTPFAHTGQDAGQSLQGKRRQIHVINRASAAVPCQTETRLSLRSDVLFAFGKGGSNDLTDTGRAQLGVMAKQIKQDLGKVSRIDVQGHADPIGNAMTNQRLSEQRAEAVRTVLLEHGIQSSLMQASGRGSAEPVVHCSGGPRSEQIACNAPNRRVELVIHGVQGDQ
ncbi:OmpA family protein [Pseudomonas denitrificans (nom. rej.)]|nr:OmpA family protein [Pseudomonas denitrificans (nom. rej.)]